MDKLTKQQACQLFIEQEIEKGLKEGKAHRAIGRELAQWIDKLFDAKVNPETIRKRADRIAAGTNVPLEPTPEDDSEKEEIQVEHGGMREGAGRPTRKEAERKREKEKRMEQERMESGFRKAYEEFYEEVRKAKYRKWETTSKTAALNCVQWLHDLITIT